MLNMAQGSQQNIPLDHNETSKLGQTFNHKYIPLDRATKDRQI